MTSFCLHAIKESNFNRLRFSILTYATHRATHRFDHDHFNPHDDDDYLLSERITAITSTATSATQTYYARLSRATSCITWAISNKMTTFIAWPATIAADATKRTQQYLYVSVNTEDCIRFMGSARIFRDLWPHIPISAYQNDEDTLCHLRQKTTPQNITPISWWPITLSIPVFRTFCND